MAFPELTSERKKQLGIIAQRRQRDVLVYAADLNKGNSGAPTSLDYSDLLPISDQLANLKKSKVDVILETPGGDGTVAEDIVKLLHKQFTDVGFIVPGYAKSAGTIMVMAGDEILMGATSALGPIDAQLFWQGKVFSAEALLEGIEKIKAEVTATGQLNRAYIPILQGISPGELQSARNALEFAKVLVTEWLAQYKFKNWAKHSSDQRPVTPEDRKARAEEIAKDLCSHTKWLTHARSIRIDDLRKMKLVIVDYDSDPELADAIRRYYTLLQMTFSTNIYKVIETPQSQIYRFWGQQAQPLPLGVPGSVNAEVKVRCHNCGRVWDLQANLDSPQPLQVGRLAFPSDNKFRCPNCSAETDLADTRRQIEAQTKKKVVT